MFFQKNNDRDDDLSKVAALLIHAARIDEDYSTIEEKIIKKALLEIGASDKDVQEIINSGKKIEKDSNQIIDFTREVKNMKEENKIKIIETLWRIIYSNNDADIYETNLMRRLTGLLYIDNKLMGDIKEKIKKEF
tara:strand:- start:777 stop:1181 length:405 start_codon:yes stop_codon:yes gene_type:complete